jgi:hypothetical protein
MNKRQRKKAIKRKYEKMQKMMEHSHHHYMVWARNNTHLPMVQWNLRTFAENRRGEEQSS